MADESVQSIDMALVDGAYKTSVPKAKVGQVVRYYFFTNKPEVTVFWIVVIIFLFSSFLSAYSEWAFVHSTNIFKDFYMSYIFSNLTSKSFNSLV